MAQGIKFEYRLWVGRTHFSELGRREAERAGQGEHGRPYGKGEFRLGGVWNRYELAYNNLPK
jgi:hypothetical protein